MAQYGIIVVPLYVVWGDEQLRDGVDINRATFYERLLRDPVHPKTSQPTPQDFVQAIQRAKADEVLIITLSGALSGTLNAAIRARELVDIPVQVIDSMSTSMGLGWQVIMAARMRDQVGDMEAMIAAARQVREKLTALFTLDTLEYLYRGGRIGGAAKFLGTMLQLKPLLAIDKNTGRIEAVERARTRQRAVNRLIQLALQGVDPARPVRVAVLHSARPDELRTFAEQVEAAFHPVETICSELGPVLGVHGGGGLLGLCVFNEG